MNLYKNSSTLRNKNLYFLKERVSVPYISNVLGQDSYKAAGIRENLVEAPQGDPPNNQSCLDQSRCPEALICQCRMQFYFRLSS